MKRINFHCLAVICLLTFATTTLAQQSSEEDPGVDIALVTKQSANLRADSSLSSRVVKQLARNDVLVLVDREAVNGWYNVLDVSSSLEGWIHESVVSITYTRKSSALPVFREEPTGTDENPVLEISNNTERTLSLRIGGERYSIPPNSV